MSDLQLLMAGAVLAGFLLGFFTLYVTLKYKAEISKKGGEFLTLKIPFLGGNPSLPQPFSETKNTRTQQNQAQKGHTYHIRPEKIQPYTL